MRRCMDLDNLHNRLNKIIKQVQIIDEVIDEDIPCEEIILKINAAKAELNKVGEIVLDGHLKHCVKDGIDQGDAEGTIDSFIRAVADFSKI